MIGIYRDTQVSLWLPVSCASCFMVLICVPATFAPPAAAWAAPSMGYGHHQNPWSPQAGWAGSSQQYPPPVPPSRGAHDEGDDSDNDDDDSDSTSDNYSSVITFPFSTYYCFRVSIQTIAVVPSLPIPA